MLRDLAVHQERISPDTWVGIDDLDSLQHLSDRLDIPHPNQTIVSARASLKDSLSQIWGADRLIILPMQSIREKLIKSVGTIETAYPHLLTISLDPFYGNPPYLHINRIADRQGQIIGHGPRPGARSLQDQIDTISALAKQNGKIEILFSDDILIHGRTISFAISEFQKRGFKIMGVLVGIAQCRTIELLSRQGIPVVAPFIYENIENIVAFRDILPGIPRGGLVMGNIDDKTGILAPQVDQNQIPFRPPYAAAPPKIPWSVTQRRTSIPDKDIRDFSIVCWTIGQQIHLALISPDSEKLINLGDLVGDEESTIGFPGPSPKHMENGRLNPRIPFIEVIGHKLRKLQGFPHAGTIYSLPK